MEAETHSTMLRLRLPHAGTNSAGCRASCCCAGYRTSPAGSDGCPLGMIAMSAVVVLSEHVVGLVAVVAAVSMAEVLAVSVAEVLAVVHVSAPVEGQSRTSPATSDSCPLGMMLGTVAEAADVQVAVQVAVSNTIQVDVLVDRRGDSCPSAGASVPYPDLLFTLFPFPTFDVAAGPLALSPFGLEEPLLDGWCGFSLRHMGTFFTLAGGVVAFSLASLGGTLAALMGAARDVTGLSETTVLDDLGAEVLGWDLNSLVLGEGREGGVGKRSMLARKSFLDTLGREDGGGLGVEEEVVVVGGVRLLNLGEDAWAGGCCEVDGCWMGVCLRLCTLGGGLTDTLGEDTWNVCMVVGVVIAREWCVMMGVLVMEVVDEVVVHAGVSRDETGREEEDTVEAVDVGVSAWEWCLCECLWDVWCLRLPYPLLCVDECACCSDGVLGIG
ncbi:hypothetical protein NDU88_001164 [Pleurodeles waltl]|uniref:Uncharacterized protein n=1 Tax=Pleurodeles waltl TaxID=8319 RepID=A0AAV7Q698_PLEWA|nr:hypothetical protein NDU88_001164 [Pleurodeles waltl]